MAAFFSKEHTIGKIVGRSVLYLEADWVAAEKLLENARLPRDRSSQPMRRAETLEYTGISEKAFGRSPHSDSVAVRAAFGSCTLHGVPLHYPDGGYAVLCVDDVLRIQCEQIMVVENLETFRFLGRYRWIDYGRQATLAVFRGDRQFSAADAASAVATRHEPVLAFADLDPAGLCIASRMPRLARLVLPDLMWLRSMMLEKKRWDLYDQQIGQFSGALDLVAHPDLILASRMMRDLRMGYAQEWMQNAPSHAAMLKDTGLLVDCGIQR